MQLDILEGFENYDEAVFKRNMQKEVLKNGLAAQNIKQTEINLLNSNRIDRKTILLNHMQMFDKANYGAQESDQVLKHEQLIQKMGSDHI